MTPAYKLYLNGHFFGHLADSNAFGDRPEPYRQQEKAMWTVYQLLQLGQHEIVVITEAKEIVVQTRNASALKSWFELVYPGLTSQLDQLVYTRYPHPQDSL